MPLTITMPALSPTMAKGTIAHWLKKEGEKVDVGDPLCEITTDKSTVEFQSIEEGYLRKIVVGEKGEALVNQAIAILTTTKDEDISHYKVEEPNLHREKKGEKEEKPFFKEEAQEKNGQQISIAAFAPIPPKHWYRLPRREEEPLCASPLAKKIAKEKGLDLSSVKGSGPHGRIIAKDLESAQKSGILSLVNDDAHLLPPGSYEEEILSPMRSVIARRLQASKMSIPHYYLVDEVKVDRLIDLRNQLKEIGTKVSYNDFIIRAAAIALKKHPIINSGYNSQENKIIRFKTVDISMAVSIPEGLITPILFHADRKSIVELSQEATLLAKKARKGSLTPEEYQGGSFTISNIGMYGIESFAAVINPPQGAILAVGAFQEKPVVQNGEVRIGHTVKLTLSSDHRVIDGVDAAEFLVTLRQLIEHPASLIL